MYSGGVFAAKCEHWRKGSYHLVYSCVSSDFPAACKVCVDLLFISAQIGCSKCLRKIFAGVLIKNWISLAMTGVCGSFVITNHI